MILLMKKIKVTYIVVLALVVFVVLMIVTLKETFDGVIID